MFLRTLHARDFRSCENTTVNFHPKLTVLVGENNAGKTNVLEALRLLFSPVDGHRSRWAEESDIRRGAVDFELRAELAELTPEEFGLLVSALTDPLSKRAGFGARYTAPAPGERRGRFSSWAGAHEGAEPEPEARDRIRCVHLPALRDASRDLASAAPGRIAFVLKHLAALQGKEDEILGAVKEAHGGIQKLKTIVDAGLLVSKSLSSLTEGVREQRADLGFQDASLAMLASDLRLRMHETGLPPEDLADSGMGYANLLYLAVVLVELEAAREAHLTLFLVEEPEAHLHPQLQTLVLQFLLEKATQAPSAGSGRIQVIVTTHSPQLSAAVSCENITLLRSLSAPKVAPANGAPPSTPRRSTVAISVRDLGLKEAHVGKIDRYLDARRAPLLFGPRTVLVEGLAEALLVPRFAEQILRGDPKKLAMFRGTSLIAIDGVDFEPYLRLLLTPNPEQHRIGERVGVLTDEDPAPRGGDARAAGIAALGSELAASTTLGLFRTPDTLESALYQGNPALMEEVYSEVHPRSGARLLELQTLPVDERARAFSLLCVEQRTSKGDFAQRLADRLVNGSQVVPPPSVVDLISWIVS